MVIIILLRRIYIFKAWDWKGDIIDWCVCLPTKESIGRLVCKNSPRSLQKEKFNDRYWRVFKDERDLSTVRTKITHIDLSYILTVLVATLKPLSYRDNSDHYDEIHISQCSASALRNMQRTVFDILKFSLRARPRGHKRRELNDMFIHFSCLCLYTSLSRWMVFNISKVAYFINPVLAW